MLALDVDGVLEWFTASLCASAQSGSELSILFIWMIQANMHQSTPAITLPDCHTWDTSRNDCKNEQAAMNASSEIHSFSFSALIHSSDRMKNKRHKRMYIH